MTLELTMIYISTSILRSCRIIDKTTKIQVECLSPPTNFFENLSIGLKMSRIRELYQIFHLKKTKVKNINLLRRYHLSIFFFTVFFRNLKDFLKEFPQSQCKFTSWNFKIFRKISEEKIWEAISPRKNIIFHLGFFYKLDYV